MQRYQVVNESDIEKIHETTLKIMDQVGIVFSYAPAREILAKHGARIDGQLVHFPKELVEEGLKSAPSSFTVYARNPERNVEINTTDTHFCASGGSSYVMDLDNGRRPSTREDFINFVKLLHMLDNIEFHHEPCEMNDLAPEIRNREIVYQTMKHSDKILMGMILGYQDAIEAIEMTALAFGGVQAIKNKPVILADPCTVTPLSYDDKAIGTLMAFAEYGQPQLVNSLCMAGATAPATLAGNVAVQNAEILAGIVLAQCINPGTPVVYSASGSNADMRTGNLTVGSPEDALMSLVNGQLAKFYNLPCRISGAITDSKCVDAQAGYESMMNLLTAEMAGGNFIIHGGGILETYSTVCYEKLIIDNEMMGMVKRINRGVEVNEDTLAYDVIKEVGPQGQFLTAEHTFGHFRKEHYTPFISDRQSVAQWADSGSLTAEQRSNAKWKQMLKEYVQPEFAAELDAELKKYLNTH